MDRHILCLSVVIALFICRATVGTGEELLCTYGSYKIINTVPTTKTNVTSFIFAVRSCSGVRLVLTGNATSLRPAYLIVIGAIKGTAVPFSRLNICYESAFTNCIYDSVDTPGILDCDTFRSFWVRWGDVMSFGHGEVVDKNIIKEQTFDKIVSPDFIFVMTDSGLQDRWIFKSGFDLQYNSPVPCDDISTVASTDLDVTESSAFSVQRSTESMTSAVVTDSAKRSTEAMTSAVQPVLVQRSTEELTSTGQTLPVTSTVSQLCGCQCSLNRWAYLKNHNLTLDELRYELRHQLQHLKDATKINTKTTTRYLARKISSYDSRTSSVSMGLVGALVISIVPFCFISIDILNLVKYLSTRC